MKSNLISKKCGWICYCIKSTDSNKTYIGVTDNLWRRLKDHNGIHGASKGAKATRGEFWYPLFIVSGFCTTQACLSYEWHVKRVRKRRKIFGTYPKGVNTTSLKRLYDSSRLLTYGRKQSRQDTPPKWWNDNLEVIWIDNEITNLNSDFIQDWFTNKQIKNYCIDENPNQNEHQQWLGIGELVNSQSTTSV